MLAGILNTALMIVIVLDVLGAAVYFGLTCLKRYRDGKTTAAPARTFGAFGGGLVPVPAGPAAMQLYGAPEPVREAVTEEDKPNSFGGRLRMRIESFGGTFSRRRAAADAADTRPDTTTQAAASGDDQVRGQVAKLNRVLDSFKEDL